MYLEPPMRCHICAGFTSWNLGYLGMHCVQGASGPIRLNDVACSRKQVFPFHMCAIHNHKISKSFNIFNQSELWAMDAHSDITFGLCKIDSVSDADLSWKESAVVPVRVREKKWPWRRIISISTMLPLKAAVWLMWHSAWYFKFYVLGWSCPHTCFQLVTSNPHNLISNKNSKPSALINFNTQWCLIYY